MEQISVVNGASKETFTVEADTDLSNFSIEDSQNVQIRTSDFNRLTDLAVKGDLKALFEIGMMYKEGIEVEQNQEKAFYIFSVAANAGYAGAQYLMGEYFSGNWRLVNGDAHQNGDDLYYIDSNEAAKWYKMAAEQGHPGAKFELGMLHYDSRITDYNKEVGIAWITQAARQGYSEARKWLNEHRLMECIADLKATNQFPEVEGGTALNYHGTQSYDYFEDRELFIAEENDDLCDDNVE